MAGCLRENREQGGQNEHTIETYCQVFSIYWTCNFHIYRNKTTVARFSGFETGILGSIAIRSICGYYGHPLAVLVALRGAMCGASGKYILGLGHISTY